MARMSSSGEASPGAVALIYRALERAARAMSTRTVTFLPGSA